MKGFMPILLVALLLAVAGNALAHGDGEETEAGATHISAFRATPFAEQAGLGEVTGFAFFDSDGARLFINLVPNGASLPQGTVLEGWVVDAGRFAGSGTNASVADQTYGPPFGDLAMDVLVSAAPYALGTGVLQLDTEGNWSLDFHIPNYNFSPYDVVVVTAESDGNAGDWDPRPGAPFFTAGMREDNAELAVVPMEVFGMVGPADAGMLDPDHGHFEVELGPTPLAANAGLGLASGAAIFHGDHAAIDFFIDLNGSPGPEGCLVLEGWVVDAGLLGGPGVSNAGDSDEAHGPPFGDIEMVGLNAAVEAAPYALSTGVAAPLGDGMLGAGYEIPGYNFDPYDAFVVTLESDCTDRGFDPRPGTPVLMGMLPQPGSM
ncbi:MAG: hypothetical protein OXP68_12950 [Anaerolineaceae bacterium]|nr:hypothetical protein [Anaerolineaceae bacterium]MDE0328968.1 hypothetical protein [Anaerolineaceae bacterium]